MTTTTRRLRATAPVAFTAARAVLAAVLAAVTTFWPQPDRSAAFGLTVLGGFLLLQGVVLALGVRRAPEDRTGRLLLGVRAALSAVGGVVALTGVEQGIALLLPLEAIVFLLVGALELTGGFRRSGGGTAGDAVVVGGLQVLVGLLIVIVGMDALFAVGVLSAWAAVVTVYLGIAAANLQRKAAA